MKNLHTFEEFVNESAISKDILNEKKVSLNLPPGIGFKESDVQTVVDYLNKKNTDDGQLEGNSEYIYTRSKNSINTAHFGEKADLKTTNAFYAIFWGLQNLKRSNPKAYEKVQKSLTATGYNFKIYIDNLHFNSNV